MKYLLGMLLVILATTLGVQAQPEPGGQPNTNGIISGKLVEASTGAPLEFVTIALFRLRDSSLVGGGVTDAKGLFNIEGLPFGRFRLTAEFMGYNTYSMDSIALYPRQTTLDVGTVQLTATSIEIKTTEVTAQRNAVQQSIDKRVYNVERDLSVQGGTATDVLQNIPSVTIDAEGKIALRGNENVTILIDGKPASFLLSGDKATALQQLPANSVESIEVITNPSAKYDAESMSGILNIVLKKNRANGLNGNINLNAGTRNKYNGSATINYKVGKFNISSTYNYRYNHMFNRGFSNRTTFDADTFYIGQTYEGLSNNQGHGLRANVDYYINKKNTFSVGGNIGYNLSDNTNDAFNTLAQNGTNYLEYVRSSHETGNSVQYDVTSGYRHSFEKPGQLLSVDFNMSRTNGDRENHFLDQTYTNSDTPSHDLPGIQQQLSDNNTQDITAFSDYTHPFKQGGKLETGVKTTFRQFATIFDVQDFVRTTNEWINKPTWSSDVKYREQIFAAYVNYFTTIKKVSVQAGARAEQFYGYGDVYHLDTSFTSKNFGIFPSVYVAYKPNQTNEMRVGVSRKLRRADFHALTPAQDFQDPYNIRVGNPQLKPEIIYNADVNYTKFWSKGNLGLSVYATQTVNKFTRIRTNDSTGISYVQLTNLDKQLNYGIDVSSRLDITKWWNLTLGANVYQMILDATNLRDDFDKKGLSYTGRASSNMRVLKNMDIQLSYNYRGPNFFPQGKMLPNQGLDIGIKKEVLKGKGSLNVRVSDVFATRFFGLDIDDVTFVQHLERRFESRIGWLGFTYRFGKSDNAQKQRPDRQKQEDRGADNMDF